MSNSFLFVDSIATDPHDRNVLCADVRIIGHRVYLVVRMEEKLGLMTYVRQPPVLGFHEFSSGVVCKLIQRYRAGESLAFPVDLSGEVRNASDGTVAHEPSTPDEARDLEDLAAKQTIRVDCMFEQHPSRGVAVLEISGSRKSATGIWRDFKETFSVVVEIQENAGGVSMVHCIQWPYEQTYGPKIHLMIFRAVEDAFRSRWKRSAT